MTSFDRVVTGPRDRLREWQLRIRRQIVDSDRPALAFLVLMTVGIVGVGMVEVEIVPQTTILLPIFLAGPGPCRGS